MPLPRFCTVLAFCLMSAAVLAIPGCSGTPAPSPLVAAQSPKADVPAAEPAPPAKSTVSPEAAAITFEDLDIGMAPDSVYEPWMLTSHVRALEGRKVRVTGFMSAAILQSGDNIRTFPLMREKECPFGPGGQAHHVIEVELQDKLRTSFRTEAVTVEGTFSVRPWKGPNGKTWSLYHLEGTKIE